jgi:opacity protein-like surface antigen
VRLHGGVSFPVGNFGNAFSTGFGFGGSIGYGLSQSVLVSWGVQHHQFDSEVSDGIDWSITPIVMNADYRLPTSGSVAPWIGGGLGLYMVDAEIPVGGPGGPTIEERDFNNFGLNFGGGISTPIASKAAFLAGLRFHWVAGDEGIIDTPFVTAQVGVGFVL